MYILGISSYYHDSAAALIKDGEVIAAANEERFSRIKHDNSFPINAINFCLDFAGISSNEIDQIAYYEKPLLKFERILTTFIATYPYSILPFIKTVPEWLGEKISVESKIKKHLGFKKKLIFVSHHISHASASYYPSPFNKAAILTIDGVGEYQTTTLSDAKDTKINPISEINFPNSIGLLYSTFTAFLGFRVNDDEYKVMGMSAYGNPIYKEKIYKLINVNKDGSYMLDLSYFKYRESFKMWSDKFESLFGRPRNGKLTQKHKDIAASLQAVTEEVYFKILNHLWDVTRLDSVCIGGGFALNSLANGKIFKNTPFKNVYIFGPAGDDGCAIGAALYAQYSISNKRLHEISLYLGTSYYNDLTTLLNRYKLYFKKIHTNKEVVKRTAKLLTNGAIIGWFQGKMEFGPRALGNRSILAAPFPLGMKDKVNIVKKRELFRPFAGSVMEQHAHEYFDLPEAQFDFRFMNFCFPVKNEKKAKIPAITHQDGTCRIQTVKKEDGIFYQLLNEFKKQTGVPIILNTSLNLKGEPIAETPEQAIKDFINSKMDYLVINNYLISKRWNDKK